MEFFLDTANIEEIKQGIKHFPIRGITCNPTIIKKEGKIDFFNHFKEIRKIIGKQRSLHIQTVSQNCDGMISDAKAILKNIDQDIYIKIPVTAQGLEAIQILKREGLNITATAVYTKMQGYLALEAGIDYLALYLNRMENLNICSKSVISGFADKISKYQYKTKILAASFKNIAQINEAFDAGAQSITAPLSLLCDVFKVPSINQAVDVFNNDWASLYENKKGIEDL
ncbi:MAG: fructose-6-phosphate aldolase [Elusimicrobiota bacterium]|jgi:TalC/MipB family fructose-6-phosphate aldolase|nr:fructose-6-phosphate aldolase [Elusimicrobiota bacterium]